jgi:hypothetical protein
MLALTSPTSGGRSVGIVLLWTKTTKKKEKKHYQECFICFFLFGLEFRTQPKQQEPKGCCSGTHQTSRVATVSAAAANINCWDTRTKETTRNAGDGVAR